MGDGRGPHLVGSQSDRQAGTSLRQAIMRPHMTQKYWDEVVTLQVTSARRLPSKTVWHVRATDRHCWRWSPAVPTNPPSILTLSSGDVRHHRRAGTERLIGIEGIRADWAAPESLRSWAQQHYLTIE